MAGCFFMIKKEKIVTEVYWYLEGCFTAGKAWLIPVDVFPFVLGRGAECNLQLPSQHISKRHAELNSFGSTISLHDLGSTNGTLVNGKKIKEPVDLKSGDRIDIGGIEVTLKTRDDTDEDIVKTTFFEGKAGNDGFADYYKLTKREREIIALLARGCSVKFIAEGLDISKGTAKNHIVEIYRKTGVHARYELIELYNNFKK